VTQPFDNRDWDVRQIADKDAEIERLKQHACQCESSVHSTQEELSQLQADIVRLKTFLIRAADALEQHQMVTGEIIAELRKAAE
jgi:chromosome segregation ATPase